MRRLPAGHARAGAGPFAQRERERLVRTFGRTARDSRRTPSREADRPNAARGWSCSVRRSSFRRCARGASCKYSHGGAPPTAGMGGGPMGGGMGMGAARGMSGMGPMGGGMGGAAMGDPTTKRGLKRGGDLEKIAKDARRPGGNRAARRPSRERPRPLPTPRKYRADVVASREKKLETTRPRRRPRRPR